MISRAWAELTIPVAALKTHLAAVVGLMLAGDNTDLSFDDFIAEKFSDGRVTVETDGVTVTIENAAFSDANNVQQWQASLIAHKVPFEMSYGCSSGHNAGEFCGIYSDVAKNGYAVFKGTYYHSDEIADIAKAHDLITVEQLLARLDQQSHYPKTIDWHHQINLMQQNLAANAHVEGA